MDRKCVFVTGGTGFTGKYLLRYLCQQGMEVRAIRRKNSDIRELAELDIQWYIGDVYDEKILAQAMQGVHQVYHLAAAYRATNLPDSEFYNVHLKSTQILAKLAKEQADFERFIHVSTVGVLGHIALPPADENTPYNPGDIYQESKAQAEQWLLDFAPKNALDFTIVRPAAIYGPGDRRLLKFFKLAKLPIIPLIGFSKGLYHLIHVEDLVTFLHFCTTIKATQGNIYICGNPSANSIQGMFSTISAYFNKPARFIRIPSTPLFWLAQCVDWVSKKCNVEPILYPRRVAFFTKDRSFDTRKMQVLPNWQYQHSEDSGLKELAQWYQEQGWL